MGGKRASLKGVHKEAKKGTARVRKYNTPLLVLSLPDLKHYVVPCEVA